MTRAWILAVIAFVVYAVTLTPGMPPIDAGEMIGAAKTFGPLHPTGYPLYLLLARFFTMLPFSPLTALSLLSALAAAAATFFLSLSLSSDERKNGFPALLLLPFAPIIWSLAIGPEVYTLHLLFLAGSFWAALQVWNLKPRAEMWLMVFSACAAVTHLSSGYFLLPLWVGLLLSSETRSRLLNPVLLVPALVILSIHLILPIRAIYGHPPFSWGDFTSIDGWWRHITGWQYRVWLFESGEQWAKNMGNFLFHLLPRQMLWVGLIPAGLGMYETWKESRPKGMWITTLFLFPAIMVSGYGISDLDSYFLPSILITVWFAAIGTAKLAAKLSDQKWMIAATILAAAAIIWIQYPRDTLIENRHQDLYSRAVLSQLPSPVVYFGQDWEIVNGPLEGLLAMGERPDVALIDVELMRRSWYIELIMRRYPNVVKGCETELFELIPALRKFERKEDISPDTLERLYRRAIAALMAKNIGRSAVCISPELEPPLGYGPQKFFVVPLLLFGRVQFSDIGYKAEPYGLKIDDLYTNPVDTRIDGRIREKVAFGLIHRATYLFYKQYREEGFDCLKMAKTIQPPADSQAWTMIQMLEREQGRRE